eukprot:scaffold20854_cov69-Amphora_coffeaeformis.AAC.1
MIPFQESHRESFHACTLEKTLGIGKIETQSDDTGDGSQGDVALLEIGHDTEFPVAFLNHAVGSNEG